MTDKYHSDYSMRVKSLKPSNPVNSTAWLLVEKVLVLATTFAVTIAIARHLMPESFGRLSFYLALVSLATPLMSLGLNSLVSREILQRPRDQDYIMGSAMALRGSVGLIVSTIGTFCAYMTLPTEDATLVVLLLFASVTNAALIVDFWLQAVMANRYAALSRISVVLVFSIARIAAVELGSTLSVFVYIFAAEFVVLSAVYILVYRYMSNGANSLRVSLVECRTLLKNSGWLLFSGIAAVLYLKIDQVMLGFLTKSSTVGIYAVAVKFSEVGYFIPVAIVTSYFPQLIDKRDRDPIDYARDIQKLNDFLLMLAMGFALLVSFSGHWLIPWLFGELYIEAVPVLLVHVWGAVFVFMRTLLSKWLISESLFRLSFMSQMAGAFCNVVLNLYLIPLYGALGAAYATVISHVVAGYLVLFFHCDLRPMARVINQSLILPWRFARRGRRLYDAIGH